jgi:GTPase SAR1 family protein
MGLCASTTNLSPEEQARMEAEARKNREVEDSLAKSQDVEKQIYKLLLLGAGESGKSTLFKQMTNIYGTGFSEEERKNKYRSVCRDNAITCMRTLVYQCKKNNQNVDEANSQAFAEMLAQGDDDDTQLTPELAAKIASLWKDFAIQAMYEKRATFQIPDCAKHFLEKVVEMSSDDWIPDEDDVLRARVRTTGIVKKDFIIEGNKFQMYDVGGQRNERKKWIHCFDNVTAVLFVVALSEYDQVLMEDEDVNRMQEALKLFSQICNSKHFASTNMVLFLNKRDLFEDKIKKVPINLAFPDYTGPRDYKECLEYVKEQFEEINKNKSSKKVYTHVTCATDKNNVHAVFDAVKDIVIRQSLAAAGLGNLTND